MHELIGFEPPNRSDRAGEDDLALLDVVELFRGVGVPDEATLRLFATYANAARTLAKAEADTYEAISRSACSDGHERAGADRVRNRFGNRVSAALEQALVMVYRRHRVHA